MRTPVLIAVRNEAATLGDTIASLPKDCQPVVIPNGCTDNTEAVAAGLKERYGITLVDCDREGKMFALQAGIRELGRQALSGPFITLDGHNRPIFPNQWLRSMLSGRSVLDPDHPAVAIGLGLFVGGPSLAANALHTIGAFRRQYRSRFNPYLGDFSGFNMLIDIAGNRNVLDGLLDLPNYWPGVDESMKDVIVDNGGTTIKIVSLLSLVTFPSHRHPGILERIHMTTEEAGCMVRDSYAADAPPNSTPYALRRHQPEFAELASISY